MLGVGATASATATIVNGGVRFVTVTNRGDGYKTAPQVAFSDAPPGGGTATGIASMISGIVDLCEPDETLFRVQSVQLTNTGFGYTVAPSVSFIGGGGGGAQAFATIGDGIVGIVSVTNGGSGFLTPPSITFVGAATSSAIAVAILNNGSVSAINMVDAGLGYTTAPTIVIQSPYSAGVGTYIFNEQVVGSASSMTARVKDWNAQTLKLQLSNLSGPFTPGELIVGQESGASYQIITGNQLLTLDEKFNDSIATDGYTQNDDIQIAANEILDFSERNPFGVP
jgi:hypothetical protein